MKQIKTLLRVIPSLVIISSCSFFMAPKYKKPIINTPKQWQNILNESFESMPELANGAWWQTYHDKALNHLVESALANNEDIQMAIGRINVAKAQLQEVHMLWVPTIGMTKQSALAGSFANHVSSDNQAFKNSINQGSNNLSMLTNSFIPSYSINIFNIIAKQDYANLSVEDSKYVKDAVRLSIIGQVIGSYIAILGLKGELYQQHKLISQISQIAHLADIQYKAGYISLSQLTNYQQQLAEAKIAISDLEDNINKLHGVLNLLASNNLDESIATSGLFTSQLSSHAIPANLIPHNVPSGVLANRPDVARAETELKMANADIGVAKSNFFPNINLTTPLGFYYAKLGSLFSTYGGFWNAQITSTMPILNLGLYALIKEKKAHYYVSYFNYIKTVKNAFIDTNDALVSHEKVIQQQQDFLSYYRLINEQTKLSDKNYKLGYASYLDYLINQLSLTNANISLIKIKLNVLKSTLAVYQAMAAGYNYNNTDKAQALKPLIGD